MAAIYDALGNYVGDDGTSAGTTPADIAKMRATLGANLESRSPLARPKSKELQQLEAIDAKPLTLDDIYLRLTTPLTKPVSRFESLQRDIASLPQQVADVTNTLFGNPFQMMVRTPIEALLRGKTSTPEINALLEKNVAPIQTPQGEEFASNVSKAFEASKLPPWPMTGGMAESIIGMPQRRVLAPSDVRALSGDAARLATQLSDVVPDFQAAQTGFQRIDPVTGKPTVGSRLQSLADEWAGVLERRQSIKDEISPFVDVASPEMYAIRKKGTKLIEPEKPATSVGSSFSVDPAANILRESVGATRDLPPYPMYREWRNEVADNMPNALNDAMRRYADERKAQMYPNLKPADAKRAFDLEFADRDANAAKLLEFFTDYLNSDAGRALAQQAGFNVVTPAQFAKRHAAAIDWLQGPYSNYIVRNLGTEGDPLVDLAAKGLTFMPAKELQNLATFAEPEQLQQMRESAGLPREGTIGVAAKAKMAELTTAQEELQAMEQRRAELYEQARQQNIDPASIPEYAAMTTPVRNLGRKVQQLENDVKNLQTGIAYEALSDVAVVPRTPEEFIDRDIERHEVPFYPAATRAGPTEKVYATRQSMLGRDLGFTELAKSIYRDVIAGDITPEQLKNLTVPKYVGKSAEQRILKEAQREKEREVVKNRVLDTAKEQLHLAQIYLPESSVIEITRAMTPEQIAKLLSVDTTVLNHCVGTCGTPPEGTRNLFTGERQGHKSLFDFEKNEFTSPPDELVTRGYVKAIVAHNDQISSIRDSNTGLPVATIQFNRLQNGKFSLGYVSGYENGKVELKYGPDIAQYLNQYTDQLGDTGQLTTNTGVFDTTRSDKFRVLANTAAKETGVPVDVIRNIDIYALPRFMTQDQFNNFVREDFAQGHSDNYVPSTAPEVAPSVFANDDLPAPDVIPPEYLNDPEQLLAYAGRRLHDLENVNNHIAALNDRFVTHGFTQEENDALAVLLADRRDYQHIISQVNARLEQLQQQQPQQLPAPPEEVNIGNFEVDWEDPANIRATLEGDQPMPVQIVNMDNARLLQFLTPMDFQEAAGVITHLQDQLRDIENDVDEIHVADTQQEFIQFMRDEPTAMFGEINPYIIEYALRYVEGRMGDRPRRGFAKGGTVRIAKTIPAMRAELRRT